MTSHYEPAQQTISGIGMPPLESHLVGLACPTSKEAVSIRVLLVPKYVIIQPTKGLVEVYRDYAITLRPMGWPQINITLVQGGLASVSKDPRSHHSDHYMTIPPQRVDATAPLGSRLLSRTSVAIHMPQDLINPPPGYPPAKAGSGPFHPPAAGSSRGFMGLGAQPFPQY